MGPVQARLARRAGLAGHSPHRGLAPIAPGVDLAPKQGVSEDPPRFDGHLQGVASRHGPDPAGNLDQFCLRTHLNLRFSPDVTPSLADMETVAG